MFISNSPRLIAGYHVLHRLSVPRHSPYALFRLNSRFAFLHSVSQKFETNSAFCLSFANNCILWVVRSKKTMIFRSYVVLSASRFLLKPTKLFPLLLYGKTFIIFNNKFFSITTICFVSFLYSVFNEHYILAFASLSVLCALRKVLTLSVSFRRRDK